MPDAIVKFAKIRCSPESSFWAKFAELKIDKFKLDEKINIHLWGSYNLGPEERGGKPLFLDYTSFNDDLETTTHNAAVPCSGLMVNTNTFDLFKNTNPQTFINTLGRELIDSLKNGSALKEPWRLMTFLVLSHADLKKYRFHYWVAHPTPFALPEMHHAKEQVFVRQEFTPEQVQSFEEGFSKLDAKSRCFFSVIVSKDSKSLEVVSLVRGVEIGNSSDKENEADIYFAFYDPCSHTAPGWPLRNLLCLLFFQCPNVCFEKWMKFISVRGPNLTNSVVYTIKTKEQENMEELRESLLKENLIGWESNSRGKMGPNIDDLSETMDPIKLAERAICLNLKLMKWRLVPELDLGYISGLKCLLLGAGTLGCSVARVLLGWGVHTLTFVDNSVVSPSNTVRQNLYTHEDAVNRRPKVEAAKNALLKIHPNLNAEGVVLQIPMPGHVVGPSMLESTRQAVEKLEKLYAEHDVVFLLLDSREARWLPTLMCASKGKIAINAALGFDSYTVQRHGTRDLSQTSSPDITLQDPTGKDLGCYFCNDVTQPGNSQTDRTLDQQCTVSRPGLSYIAAGLAVELLVALTQHEDRAEARALLSASKDCGSTGLLGGVPHTIRGSLWNHETQLTVTHRFASCTACSVPVIGEYRARGFDFVLDACNKPNYLERLAGIEALLSRPGLDEMCFALDSSEEDEN
ncbi:ubiquitin-like modifier-activating enzyme ATG7 [Copidosoma floridanum]|uniref:ubiquitin-like modifier-activating enzyme ATG7 n=1 Tax=Copidosoma floridanum TaxID=29053 RepID=UPI0006C97F0E|nr:ubiquitin-like modifier-activating enzyme ATG7 [Copidosoma floridanum]